MPAPLALFPAADSSPIAPGRRAGGWAAHGPDDGPLRRLPQLDDGAQAARTVPMVGSIVLAIPVVLLFYEGGSRGSYTKGLTSGAEKN